jgi:hypothetical protein
MKTRFACRCLLCQLESHLKQRLDRESPAFEYQELTAASALLSAFPTASALTSHLRTCRSSGNGIHTADSIVLELLHASRTDGAESLARDLLLLAFIPVLHSTSRQIASRYPLLSTDDTAQHLVVSLLEVLGSGELLRRSSHLPFAISRKLKRDGFVWAARETRSPGNGAGDAPFSDASVTTDAAESFDQAILLRHFLFRCQREKLLTGPDLELLVHIKLEGNTGEEPGRPLYSNALRQRIKRLLQRLRQAARTPRRTEQGP